MELRHLRYFIAVAEAENVSRAALKLHVSQPGLSRQVRDLEEELGFALFERSAKSVKLTEAGHTFLKEAQAVLARLDQGVLAARDVAAGGRGELHVGYAPSPTARILPQTLRAFQAELPNVRVRLHDLSTEEMLAGLREGKLQMALMVKPAAAILRGLRFTDLTTDQLCFAVAPKHPLGKKLVITVAEIVREPLVVYSRSDYPDYHASLDELFAHSKIRPRIVEEHDGVTSIIAAVESGAGAALLSESVACMAGPRLKLIPISPALAPAVIGAATSKAGISPAAEQFLKCAKAVATAHLSK
jgi:DNA-binding transcriptional LysR family regulator